MKLRYVAGTTEKNICGTIVDQNDKVVANVFTGGFYPGMLLMFSANNVYGIQSTGRSILCVNKLADVADMVKMGTRTVTDVVSGAVNVRDYGDMYELRVDDITLGTMTLIRDNMDTYTAVIEDLYHDKPVTRTMRIAVPASAELLPAALIGAFVDCHRQQTTARLGDVVSLINTK